jgi:hypothetical protein
MLVVFDAALAAKDGGLGSVAGKRALRALLTAGFGGEDLYFVG